MLDEVVVVVDVAISPERAGTSTTPYGRQYCAGVVLGMPRGYTAPRCARSPLKKKHRASVVEFLVNTSSGPPNQPPSPPSRLRLAAQTRRPQPIHHDPGGTRCCSTRTANLR